jgi:hypothetical protein
VSELISLLDDYYKEREQHWSDILRILANAIETREAYTYRHSISVAEISEFVKGKLYHILSEKIEKADKSMFELIRKDLNELREVGERVFDVVLLHDVGKIGIKNEILEKDKPLEKEEREEMDKHPSKGAELLNKLPEGDPLKHQIIKVAKYHHEDFDGLGIPEKLNKWDIPILARVIRVVDSYHAMTTTRPYRKFWSTAHLYALTELIRNAGTQFDPNVVEAFLFITKEGGLSKEDYLIEKLNEKASEIKKEKDIEENAMAKNCLNLIKNYIEKLSIGKSAEEIKQEVAEKTQKGLIPESFREIFNEAFDFSDRIILDLKFCAKIYLNLFKDLENLKVFDAISNFVDYRKKHEKGYRKEIDRKIISIFIDKGIEKWLEKSGLLSSQEIEQISSTNSLIEKIINKTVNKDEKKELLKIFTKVEDLYDITKQVIAELAKEEYRGKKEELLYSLNEFFEILLAKIQA